MQAASLSMDGIRALNGASRYFLTVAYPLINSVRPSCACACYGGEADRLYEGVRV